MIRGPLIPWLAWCEVHQRKAFTKDHAKKLARILRSRKDSSISRYPCGWIPNAWHVGHLPLAVVEGRLTRHEVYGD